MEIFKIIIKEFAWFVVVISITIAIVIPLVIIAGIANIQIYPQSLDEPVSPLFVFGALIAQNLSLLTCALWRRKFEKEVLAVWNIQARAIPFLTKVSIGILFGVAMIVAVYCQEFILTYFFDKTVLEESVWGEVRNFSFNNKIFMLILGAIFSPIVEELYFREAMFGSIYRQGFPAFAMFFSCAIFGIIHLNFIHIFAYLIYGIGFALIYLKTKSLISSITAHILINSIFLSIVLFW
jgi:membrane protease YdiL (CAAX protease family)